jgi:hypothetical protein
MELRVVHQIIWRREEDNFYLVQWEGCSLASNTYESEKNLPPDLVAAYEGLEHRPVRGYRPDDDNTPLSGELQKSGTCSWCTTSGCVGWSFGRKNKWNRNVRIKFKSAGKYHRERKRMVDKAKFDPRLHAEVMQCQNCERKESHKQKLKQAKTSVGDQPKVPSPTKTPPRAPLLGRRFKR